MKGPKGTADFSVNFRTAIPPITQQVASTKVSTVAKNKLGTE